MNEITTLDGYLARATDEGFAIAFDEATLGQQTVDALTNRAQDWQIVGRSALGIVAGMDIEQADQPVSCENGSVLVPINITAHANLGQQLLPRLDELLDEHNPGQPLRWNRHRLGIGRGIQTGGLVQLSDEELAEALHQDLIASGDYPDDEADLRIENDSISLPLEPWELVPNMASLGDVETLRPMLQEGKSARAFAFDHMRPEARDARHKISNFVVGSVLFSPGPFYCQVVEAISPEGVLPQIPSAAWFDSNRSGGLHDQQLPGHRGRQIEVLNTDLGAAHSWLGTRVVIKVFRPNENSDQADIDSWMGMSTRERQDQHYFGYGISV